MIMAFKLKNDYLGELERRLRMLEKSSVKVGMFDNGKHSEDSDFTNVQLFAYLSRGDRSRNLPPRPVTQLAFMWNPLKTSPLKKELKIYFLDINRKKTQKDVDKILHSVGNFYAGKIRDIMGDPSKIASNSSWTIKMKQEKGLEGNTPFVEYGKLKSLVNYKIGETEYSYKGNK